MQSLLYSSFEHFIKLCGFFFNNYYLKNIYYCYVDRQIIPKQSVNSVQMMHISKHFNPYY